jgi:hypothetical protein
VDRALGTGTIAEALRRAGCAVEIHDQHFPQAAKDTEWLPEVGRRRWVVLTKDHHIRTRQNELVALLSANVAAFVHRGGSDGTRDGRGLCSRFAEDEANAHRSAATVCRAHFARRERDADRQRNASLAAKAT